MTTTPPQSRQALRIFFTYAAADKQLAQKIRRVFSVQPFVRLFTPDDFSVSDEWQSRMQQEIRECDLFVVLLSFNALLSDWVLFELGGAWGVRKPVIAVTTKPELVEKLPMSIYEAQQVSIEDFQNPEIMYEILSAYQHKGAA